MDDFELQEGELTFTFSGVQYAGQYDGWIHYQQVFQSAGKPLKKEGKGAKAVDFLVVLAPSVWLIEVKDYSQHLREKPSDLVDEVAMKVRDTMAGLFSAKVMGSERAERTAAATALNRTKIRVGLYLELPSHPGPPGPLDHARLQQQLESRVRFADPNPKVFDRRNIPSGLPLTVA